MNDKKATVVGNCWFCDLEPDSKYRGNGSCFVCKDEPVQYDVFDAPQHKNLTEYLVYSKIYGLKQDSKIREEDMIACIFGLMEKQPIDMEVILAIYKQFKIFCETEEKRRLEGNGKFGQIIRNGNNLIQNFEDYESEYLEAEEGKEPAPYYEPTPTSARKRSDKPFSNDDTPVDIDDFDLPF